MATMNRNVNLEEINADGFIDIPYLRHQTILQKVFFWGSVVIGIGWNVVGSFVLHLDSTVQTMLTVLILGVGVLFGCNYNEDFSLLQYFYLIFFHDKVVLRTKPMEDIDQIKVSFDRIAKEEEAQRKMEEAASPEEQKKLMIRVIIGALIFVVIFIIVTTVLSSIDTEVIHHIVEH